MSNAIPNCAKCGKALSGKVKIANGKKYHEACAPTPSVPVAPLKPIDVQAEVIQPPEDPPEDVTEVQVGTVPVAPRTVVPPFAKAKTDASEMRHIMFFNWQGLDGTVFNQTVRGSNFVDFVEEWNSVLEWIVTQGGCLVNTGKSTYAESPQKPASSKPASAPADSRPMVPQSVDEQSVKFEHDGVKYMVGLVKEMRVKFNDKTNQFMVNVKVPPFLQYGVPAWKEIAETIWGDLSKLSLTEPLPITENLKWVIFSLKEDGKPNKVVGFRATKNG